MKHPLHPTPPLTVTHDPRVFIDSLDCLWYIPGEDKAPQVLADSEDVCGVWPFVLPRGSSSDNAAIKHDHMYERYSVLAKLGWTREDMDDYYLKMLQRDGASFPRTQYVLVRALGWAPFYWRVFQDWRKRK